MLVHCRGSKCVQTQIPKVSDLLLCLVGILASGYLFSIHVRFSTGQASLTESCSRLSGNSGCAVGKRIRLFRGARSAAGR